MISSHVFNIISVHFFKRNLYAAISIRISKVIYIDKREIDVILKTMDFGLFSRRFYAVFQRV